MSVAHPKGGAARFSNNFDFLRFVAVTAIIVTHAHSLTMGYPNMRLYDPFLLMGQAALAAFFVISGYLIPVSLGVDRIPAPIRLETVPQDRSTPHPRGLHHAFCHRTVDDIPSTG